MGINVVYRGTSGGGANGGPFDIDYIVVGGGGGGGGASGTQYAPGNGGSGIVVIRYLGYPKASGGGEVTYDGTYTYHYFRSDGTFTPY